MGRKLALFLALIALSASAGPVTAYDSAGTHKDQLLTPISSPIRHACGPNGCHRCPKGEYRCNGKCISNKRACRLIP
ncbi:MAG: hypothetical protein ACHP7N_02250 [Caulobacterales bacterium]